MSPIPRTIQDDDLPQDGEQGALDLNVARWRGDLCFETHDQVAVERPIALEFNGISHAVMLATPCDLEAFALGFSLSEGIIKNRSDLFHVEIEFSQQGITLHCEISSEAFLTLKERRRNLTGRTGCGLCGVESLEQALPALPAPTKPSQKSLRLSALHHALATLPELQQLNRLTGALHGAAWSDMQGELQLVYEDVGRHNALDKLIGAMARKDMDFGNGFAIVTSRASVEMVHKAAMVGIQAMAAISAPTTLAVQTAEQAGMVLLGFARGNECVAYAHAERIFR